MTPMLLHPAQTKHATLARLEPDACQPSVRHLSDGCPTSVDACPMPVRCLSDASPTPVRRLSDASPTLARRLSDVCPTPARRMPYACPTRAVEPGLHESALRRLQNAYVRSDTC